MDFHPDPRSIYFQSLTSSPFSYLANTSFGSIGGQNNFQAATENRFQTALSVLKKGIGYESANERAYFDNLLNNSKLDPELKAALKEQLSNIFLNKENIDYSAFVKLINNVMLGEEQFQTILSLEQQRLNYISTKTDELVNKRSKLKKADTEKARKQAVKIDIYNEYLKKHTLQSYRGYFPELISTIDNLMSDFINKTINKVLNNSEIVGILQASYDAHKGVGDPSLYTSIINSIVARSTEADVVKAVVDQAMNDNKTNMNEMINKIITDISDNFEIITINGQQQNFGVKKGAEFKNIQQIEDQINISGEKLADQFLSLIKKMKTEKSKFNFLGDNDSIEKYVSELDELQGNINEYDKLLGKQNKSPQEIQQLKNLENEIPKAKRSLSTRLKQSIQQTFDNMINKELIPKVVSDIKNTMEDKVEVKITGPSYSEVVDTVLSKLKFDNIHSILSGYKNLKADTVTITVSPLQIKSAVQLPNSGEATNYAQGKKAYFNAIKSYKNTLEGYIKKNIDDLKTQKKLLQELRQILQDTIIVTETVKTFDTYQNDIGFVNGSLGPNIGAQLGNFKELFSSAGVSLTDSEMMWLEVAIVNCSPAAIGAGNKGPIERFLSTMAGFAVFDEGSAEIQLIAHQAEDYYQKSSSPKLIHLYKLNGMYFPGSYILQKIYNNLTGAVNSMIGLSKEVNNDGAKIRATATEAIINHNIHDLHERWANTYAIASSSQYTSIEVTFLSGLLNIVNQLINNATVL